MHSFVGWGFAPDPTGGAYRREGDAGERTGREEREGVRPLP